MRIFYDTKTGDVVGTVEGFDDDKTEGIMMVPGGSAPSDIGVEVIGLGHRQEELARRLMDPRDPLKIHYLEFKGGIKELSDKDKKKKDDSLKVNKG